MGDSPPCHPPILTDIVSVESYQRKELCMKKVIGRNGLLKNVLSKRSAKRMRRKFKEKIQKRKDLLAMFPEEAEAERKLRVEKYLKEQNVSASN